MMGKLLRGESKRHAELRVNQVMSQACAWVSPSATLADVVEDHLAGYGHRCFLVGHGEKLQGVFTVREIRSHPVVTWSKLTAAEVMVPMDRLATVAPDVALPFALERMAAKGALFMPVFDHGRMVGLLLAQGRIVTGMPMYAEA